MLDVLSLPAGHHGIFWAGVWSYCIVKWTAGACIPACKQMMATHLPGAKVNMYIARCVLAQIHSVIIAQSTQIMRR